MGAGPDVMTPGAAVANGAATGTAEGEGTDTIQIVGPVGRHAIRLKWKFTYISP
jgi:hypothetical protein